MLDEKDKNNSGLFIMNDGEFQPLRKAIESNLGNEKEVDGTPFKAIEECVIPLDDKPLKIYYRTKNRRIKKKQVKKSALLKITLELEKCDRISKVVKC